MPKKITKTIRTTKSKAKVATKAKAAKATSPSDQAIKLYQQYTKQLETHYVDLVGSVQKFLKSVRSSAEELEEKNDAAILSQLDESLKSAR